MYLGWYLTGAAQLLLVCGQSSPAAGMFTFMTSASSSMHSVINVNWMHAEVYLSHGSTNITTNNTEIPITDIGEDAVGGLPSLICQTDLTACCRSHAENNGNGGLGQWGRILMGV